MNLTNYQTIKIESGQIITLQMPMSAFEDRRIRNIRVYLPPEYDEKIKYPVLYMHDGQNLFCETNQGDNNWHINSELESKYSGKNKIIVVGVDNADTRMSELCPNMPINSDSYKVCNLSSEERIIPTGHLYAKFITEQLKPFIDYNFATRPECEYTAIGGSSMGGLMSLYMALEYPDVYGKALIFSPNFVMHELNVLSNWIQGYNFKKIESNRFFIFHGGIGLEKANWPYVQAVVQMMEKRGIDNEHMALIYDSRQPHYETAWRKYFIEAIHYLFSEYIGEFRI